MTGISFYSRGTPSLVDSPAVFSTRDSDRSTDASNPDFSAVYREQFYWFFSLEKLTLPPPLRRSPPKVEQAAHDQMVKLLATEKLDGNHDLVKMLNSLGARAAAFTIRDEQVR